MSELSGRDHGFTTMDVRPGAFSEPDGMLLLVSGIPGLAGLNRLRRPG
jgi:hypothetical protein